MRTLAHLMKRSRSRMAELTALDEYVREDLGADIVAWIAPGHRRHRWLPDGAGLSNCALKTALAAALRDHLGPDWFIQIDAPYPDHRGQNKRDVADVVAWSPRGTPVVFEVQGASTYTSLSGDLDKISHHATELKSSPVVRGYVVFPVYEPRRLTFWRDMRSEWQPAYPVPVPFLGAYAPTP